MRKKIEVEGKNGIFTGVIDVEFKYRSEIVPTHNRSTHDGETRRYFHRVRWGLLGPPLFSMPDFVFEDDALKIIDKAEKNLRELLESRANDQLPPNVKEELAKRGFS